MKVTVQPGKPVRIVAPERMMTPPRSAEAPGGPGDIAEEEELTDDKTGQPSCPPEQGAEDRSAMSLVAVPAVIRSRPGRQPRHSGH